MTPSRISRVPRWSIVAGLLLLIGSGTIAGLTLRSQASGSATPETSFPDSRGPVAIAHVDVEGGISKLYPMRQGQITAILVKEGQLVSEGAALLRLDDTLAKIQVKEAEIALLDARQQVKLVQDKKAMHAKQMKVQEAAVTAAQKRIEAAQANHDKVKKYFEDKLQYGQSDVKAASKVVEEAQAGLKAEKAKLEAMDSASFEPAIARAKLDVEAKQQQLERAKYALSLHTLKAPTTGTVLRILVATGDLLGASPTIPAIEFCPDKPLIVRAEVEQEFASSVRVGQKATITDDAASDAAEWTGTVERVSKWYAKRRIILLEPKQFNDVRTQEVIIKVKLDKKSAPLLIGQRVRVQLK